MDVFLVRKPIFDRRQSVFAYEILYREQQAHSQEGPLQQMAALSPATDAVLHPELHRITRGRKAFIRYGSGVLPSDSETLLPAPMVIVEILEELEPAAVFIESCRKLKAVGFQLALGDFALALDNTHPLLDLIDFIKIDFSERPDPEIKVVIDRIAAHEIKFIAHRVDTREEFQLALDAGFDYFQGSFFNKPVIIPNRDIPAYKLNQLRILHELNRDDLDFGSLEKVIKQDAALSYKLLTCVNSVVFGVRPTVSSIRHALTLLGEHEIRKWASMVTLTDMAQDKPSELLVISLVRANFCASLAPVAGMRTKVQELFLVGLLSLLDVIVGRPMAELMQSMPLGSDIQTALLGGGNQYRAILSLVVSYERGDLERFFVQACELNMDEALVTDLYLRSIDLTEEAMQLYGPRLGTARA
jgi:EAL and modified HD-GYP domain-containing signal transduction protein